VCALREAAQDKKLVGDAGHNRGVNELAPDSGARFPGGALYRQGEFNFLAG